MLGKPVLLGADGLSNTLKSELETALEYLFNGTTWDRRRNNIEVTLLASAARTATVTSSDQVNYNGRGVLLTIDITAVSGTSPTLRVDVENKDPISANYSGMSATPNRTATGTYMHINYPSVTGAVFGSGVLGTNISGVVIALPRTWRINAAIGGTTPSFTFSIAATVLL